jgi:signal transduction histidine kinase
MGNIKSKSLTKIALIYSACFVSCFFISYAIFNIYNIKVQKVESLQLRLDQRASIMAEGLSLPLWNLDDEQIKSQLDVLKNDSAYCGFVVTDNEGKEIVNSELQKINSENYVSKKDIYYRLGDDYKKIGNIEICFSNEEVLKSVKKAVYSSSLFTVILIATVILVIYAALNKILKPLEKIRIRISKISRSRNKIIEPELLQYTEIASISETFNQMIDDLNSSDESLLKANQNLEHKVLERTKELNDYKDNLEKIVQHRTLEVVEEKEKAEKANKLKSEFISNISHELRTPMHAIISYSKLSIEKLNAGQPEKLQKYIENTLVSAERLLQLINDVLDISKLESGKMDFKFDKKNILELIEYSMEEIKSLADAKSIKFSTNVSASSYYANIDKNKIIQVLINIISNAIKFSPKDSEIKILVDDTTLEDEFLTSQPALKISFIDQGIGIPEGELTNIFDKFVQSSKTKSGAGGTGLGLSIAKDIIDAHKGKIYAENNSISGACFVIILLK